MYSHLVVADEGPFRVITMNRAHRRNSLSEDHLAELDRALADAGESDARGIILAGEGPVFSSGHDFADMVDRDLVEMQRLLDLCAVFMQRIMEVPQVVIAQVHALATAAGCQLVAACDLAVAAESARFQLPGGRGGLFCTTPSVAVSRTIGRKRAFEMLATGDPIDAHTAADWGLVNKVVPDAEVPAATRDLLTRATRGSKLSKGIGKRAFYRHLEMDLHRAYEYASEVMASSATLPVAKENMRAFMDKKPAVYD